MVFLLTVKNVASQRIDPVRSIAQIKIIDVFPALSVIPGRFKRRHVSTTQDRDMSPHLSRHVSGVYAHRPSTSPIPSAGGQYKVNFHPVHSLYHADNDYPVHPLYHAYHTGRVYPVSSCPHRSKILTCLTSALHRPPVDWRESRWSICRPRNRSTPNPKRNH